MKSCAFFGHSDTYWYFKDKDKIKNIIIDLIENHEVTQFYNGCHGDFDSLCADIVADLKKQYPYITNTMVLSYHPTKNFWLPFCFDDSIYLLEKKVPPKFAIYYTNRRIVEISDFIVSGVNHDSGGAFTACQYAKRINKTVINIFED